MIASIFVFRFIFILVICDYPDFNSFFKNPNQISFPNQLLNTFQNPFFQEPQRSKDYSSEYSKPEEHFLSNNETESHPSKKPEKISSEEIYIENSSLVLKNPRIINKEPNKSKSYIPTKDDWNEDFKFGKSMHPRTFDREPFNKERRKRNRDICFDSYLHDLKYYERFPDFDSKSRKRSLREEHHLSFLKDSKRGKSSFSSKYFPCKSIMSNCMFSFSLSENNAFPSSSLKKLERAEERMMEKSKIKEEECSEECLVCFFIN